MLLLGVLVTPFLPQDAAGAYATVAVIAGTVTAGITMLRKLPRVKPEECRAWRLLGISMLVIAVGMVIFAISFVTSYAAAFGWPDLGFLTGYAIGLVGIALLPHTTGNSLQRLRLLLDGIIGAVALGALAWVFLYSEIADALSDSPPWERIVGSAYPMLDIMMLIVVMIVLVRRSTYRFDSRLILLVVGATSLAVADLAFLITGAGRSFSDAEPLFPLTLLAIAAFVLLGTTLDHPVETREYAQRPSTPLWALVLPYGTAAVMVSVLVARAQWTGTTTSDTVLVAGTVIVATMVLIRQGVAIRENRRFVEDQRSALAASISHELRTPLTAMVGFLELLDAGQFEDADEQREVVSIVNDQASYLTGIVADLVMLASDNSEIELTVGALPVDELAWSAVHNAALDPAIIRVRADGAATAYVDEARMKQAIANLLTNADRYGGDRIELVAEAEGGDLVIEVHDNGPGVPKKHELVIWEKFERGPHRLNATVPGSGIGLAITSAIASAHGGAAGYRRSMRLGGACFWIRLPARVQRAAEPEAGPVIALAPEPDDEAQTA